MASSDSTVTGTVVETHTQSAAEKNKKKTFVIKFVPFIRVFRASLSNSVKLSYKRLRSRLILAAAYLNALKSAFYLVFPIYVDKSFLTLQESGYLQIIIYLSRVLRAVFASQSFDCNIFLNFFILEIRALIAIYFTNMFNLIRSFRLN